MNRNLTQAEWRIGYSYYRRARRRQAIGGKPAPHFGYIDRGSHLPPFRHLQALRGQAERQIIEARLMVPPSAWIEAVIQRAGRVPYRPSAERIIRRHRENARQLFGGAL